MSHWRQRVTREDNDRHRTKNNQFRVPSPFHNTRWDTEECWPHPLDIRIWVVQRGMPIVICHVFHAHPLFALGDHILESCLAYTDAASALTHRAGKTHPVYGRARLHCGQRCISPQVLTKVSAPARRELAHGHWLLRPWL